MTTKNSDVVELVSKLEAYFKHHPVKLSSGETLAFSRKPQTLHFEVGGAMLDVGGKSASDAFPCSFWTNVEGLPRGKGFGAFRALEKPATAHSAHISAFAKDFSAVVAEWFNKLPSQTASTAPSKSGSPASLPRAADPGWAALDLRERVENVVNGLYLDVEHYDDDADLCLDFIGPKDVHVSALVNEDDELVIGGCYVIDIEGTTEAEGKSVFEKCMELAKKFGVEGEGGIGGGPPFKVTVEIPEAAELSKEQLASQIALAVNQVADFVTAWNAFVESITHRQGIEQRSSIKDDGIHVSLDVLNEIFGGLFDDDETDENEDVTPNVYDADNLPVEMMVSGGLSLKNEASDNCAASIRDRIRAVLDRREDVTYQVDSDGDFECFFDVGNDTQFPATIMINADDELVISGGFSYKIPEDQVDSFAEMATKNAEICDVTARMKDAGSPKPGIRTVLLMAEINNDNVASLSDADLAEQIDEAVSSVLQFINGMRLFVNILGQLPDLVNQAQEAATDDERTISDSEAPDANAAPRVTREMAEITSDDVAQLLSWVQLLIDTVKNESEKTGEKSDEIAENISKKFGLPVAYIEDAYLQKNADWALEPVFAWMHGADAKYEQRQHDDDPEGAINYTEDELKIQLIDRAVAWHPSNDQVPFREFDICKRNLQVWYTLRFILTRNPGVLQLSGVNWREQQAGISEYEWTELSVPPAVAIALAKSPDPKVRGNVAHNATTPPDTLSELATDPDDGVREWLASNDNTPAEALRKLAAAASRLSSDSDKNVLGLVGSNANTPVDVLQQLAISSDDNARYCVAGNPNTPVEALAELAKDPQHTVRAKVARNASTPAELLVKLLHDENEYVRWRAAQNPNTPKQDSPAAAPNADDVEDGWGALERDRVESSDNVAATIRDRIGAVLDNREDVTYQVDSDGDYECFFDEGSDSNFQATIMLNDNDELVIGSGYCFNVPTDQVESFVKMATKNAENCDVAAMMKEGESPKPGIKTLILKAQTSQGNVEDISDADLTDQVDDGINSVWAFITGMRTFVDILGQLPGVVSQATETAAEGERTIPDRIRVALDASDFSYEEDDDHDFVVEAGGVPISIQIMDDGGYGLMFATPKVISPQLHNAILAKLASDSMPVPLERQEVPPDAGWTGTAITLFFPAEAFEEISEDDFATILSSSLVSIANYAFLLTHQDQLG